ncbi:MAG: ankyrin repeat domain-containing protein [Rickettsiales bacterium]|nr:MAG: ankyrin repeat domain-containing protein [Rickettsiales bacterium]
MTDHEVIQKILQNWDIKEILANWDSYENNIKSDILIKCIDDNKTDYLKKILEKEIHINNIKIWDQSIASHAIVSSKIECFEAIFAAGGRCQMEEISNFFGGEREYFFKFMFKHKDKLSEEELNQLYDYEGEVPQCYFAYLYENRKSLTEDRIVKTYEKRWKMITSKVYKEKWEKIISENNIEVLKDIFEKNPGSFSAEDRVFNLSESIFKNKPEILELLLQNQVDPNVFLSDQSPLKLAMTMKHTECVDILLKYGACLTEDEMDSDSAISENVLDNNDFVKETKKENIEESKSLSYYLINDFNKANNAKSSMLQRFIKMNELKAANILVSKNILLDEEQIAGLDEAQKLIYNELIDNAQAPLAGEVDLLNLDIA